MTLITSFLSLPTVILFFKHCYILLNNGLSINQALDALKSYSAANTVYVSNIQSSLDNGADIIHSFHSLFSNKVFNCSLYNLNLPDLKGWLKLYISFLTSIRFLVTRFFKQILYPIFTLFVCICLVLFLFFYIIPSLSKQYELFNISVPSGISFLLGLNAIIFDFFPFFVLLIIVFLFILYNFFLPHFLFALIKPFLLLELFWSFYLLLSQGLDIKSVVNIIHYSDKHSLFFDYETFKKEFFLTASLAHSFRPFIKDEPLFITMFDSAENSLNYCSLFKDIIELYEALILSRLTTFLNVFQPLLLFFTASLIVIIFMISFYPYKSPSLVIYVIW